jgi:hypothetical protein
MEFLEKTLEDIIFDSLQNEDQCNIINKRGLNVGKPYLIKRQFRIGNYGICDIITLNKPQYIVAPLHIGSFFEPEHILITIYELKQNTISLDSLLQLIRYLKGVKSWLTKFHKKSLLYFIKGILIGDSIDLQNDFIYLFENFTYNEENTFLEIEVYAYNYELDGLTFKSYELDNYTLVNEGFD